MFLAEKRGRGMSRGKHTEAEMIAALKQLEAGRKAEDVAREVGVSKHTIYAWKAKYGGCESGPGSQATAGWEHEVEKAGGGSESGQRDVTDRFFVSSRVLV